MTVTITSAAAAAAESDPWLTRPAVGALLGASVRLAERLIDDGEISPAYRIGGRVMVRRSAVDAYLERVRIAPLVKPSR